jgi:hypothetical protein
VTSTSDYISQPFSFFVDTGYVSSTNYTIGITGYGHTLQFGGSAFNSTSYVISISGLGTNDSYTVRSALQAAPVRRVFNVSQPSQTVFTLSSVGQWTASTSNADIYYNGTKLGYSNASYTDYTVDSSYDTFNNVTNFTLTTTNPVFAGDIVEAVVWPVVPSTSAYSSGYLYQKLIQNGPWYYNTSNTWVPTGSNVGIGTVAPTSALHVVGDVYCSGTTYTSNLVVNGANYSGSTTSVPTTISTATTFSASGPAVNISNGYLKAPNQYAFCYAGSGGDEPVGGGKITYSAINFNIGGAYNGTDTFTAPVTGVYLFTFSAYVIDDSAELKRVLGVSGLTSIIGTVSHTGQYCPPIPVASCSIVIKLLPGDTVAVYAGGGGANCTSTADTYFSGALLFAT